MVNHVSKHIPLLKNKSKTTVNICRQVHASVKFHAPKIKNQSENY